MKTNLKVLAIAGLFVWVIEAGHAGPVGPLTSFTAGAPAKASEVNEALARLEGREKLAAASRQDIRHLR
jgi:hypothetical protein